MGRMCPMPIHRWRGAGILCWLFSIWCSKIGRITIFLKIRLYFPVFRVIMLFVAFFAPMILEHEKSIR